MSPRSDRISDFIRFVEEVRGYQPFPWQLRLVEWLLSGEWPSVIDVPTGLGKTSVIDAWAYCLALSQQNDELGTLPFPRRLCYLVDRRIIVDQANQHAISLAERLEGSPDGVVGEVARGLRVLSGGAAAPLAPVRMRGGITWESRWLARPDQAAVVTGTVDQLGSRLLFRGYGASPSMMPLDAALVGLDTWVVVDEAHISEPLVETVHRVRSLQAQPGAALADRAIRLTVMSATATTTGPRLRADLASESDDERVASASAEATRRLTARKPAALVEFKWLKARRGKWRKQSKRFGEALAELARGISGTASVVGLIANTISTARSAFNSLIDQGEEACLLIGRCREYERRLNEKRWLDLAGLDRPHRDTRLFVVATQTVEVGVNLDFDLLVTEAAPLPSLIQRFGRVNRMGNRDRHDLVSAVVYAPFAHADDPVYGPATSVTWEWLASKVPAQTLEQFRDLPSVELTDHLEWAPSQLPVLTSDRPERAVPKAPRTPILLGSHLERWSCTQPLPAPDQPVAPFLHGVERGIPDVSVAWRAEPPLHLDLDGTEADLETRWREWLALAPPVSSEFVEVPVWEVRALLANLPPPGPTADLEGVLEPEDRDVERQGDPVGITYRSLDQVSLITGPDDVNPGDRVILPSTLGGHDEWGWTGCRSDGSLQVPDIADAVPERKRPSLRLSEGVLATWGERGVEAWKRIAELELEAEEASWLPAAIAAMDESGVPHQLGQNGIKVARTDFRSADATPVYKLWQDTGDRGLGIADAVSDTEEVSTAFTARRVALFDHGSSVGETARRFAENLGLSPGLTTAVEVAGRYHDLGKADPRFQAALLLGDRLQAAAGLELLAKSGIDPRHPLARRARSAAGLPRRFRHEAVSERLVEQLLERSPQLAAGSDPELILHLVGAHHGYGRPLMPPLAAPDGKPFELEIDAHPLTHQPRRSQVDWSHPARFELLNTRYGWWGLAMLETIVRLADMLCSEEGR